jgi:GT2 family glycosyltransferase
MAPSITAVLVTRGVTRYLHDTLAALATQTRVPDRVVVVDAAPYPQRAVPDDVARLASDVLAGLGTDLRIAAVPGAHNFGDAVREALTDVPLPAAGVESTGWLWFLHDDSAPAPTALAELTGAVEHTPSVAIAGAKQRSWSEPVRLLEVGVTTSRFGRRMTGVEEGEVDQGQHDRRDDVLAVGLAGALVRTEVWDALGGTDPSLGPFGDGFDLSRRARLAGHRVVVVPTAVVRHAQASYRGLRHGSSDPHAARSGSARSAARSAVRAESDESDPEGDPRRSFAARRRAWVHARLAAEPAVLLPFAGIGFLIAGVVRSLARVAGKEPGLAVAELAAPVAALVHPRRIAQARRLASRVQQIPRRSLRPLEASWQEVLREQYDAHLTRVELRKIGGAPSELELAELAALATRRRFGLGVLAVLLVALTTAVLGTLVGGVIRGGSLVGGALLPARVSLGELWRAASSGWVAGDFGNPGPADPLLTVLAPFSALTGGTAGGAVDLLFLGALVLAGLGAWFAAGAATRSVGVRLWAALVWVAAPSLLLALDGGRLGALVAHVALPWVALGVARAIGVQRRDIVLSGLIGARRVHEDSLDDAAVSGPDAAQASRSGGTPGATPADPRQQPEPVSPAARPTGSVAAAAGAGLAFAIAAAGAPVLLPFGLLALLIVAVIAPRRRRRVALIVLPALALLGPTIAEAATRVGSGSWRVLLADPGLPLPSTAAPAWQQLLAWPVQPAGWVFDQVPDEVLRALPFVLGGVVLLFALLALVRGATVARGVRAGWLVAACGLAAAIAAGRVETAVGTADVVRGWSGPGASLLLLGLLTAAVLGTQGVRALVARHRFGWRQVAVILLTIVAVIAPLVPLAEWTARTRTAVAGAPGAIAVSTLEGAVVPAVGQEAQTSPDRSRVLCLGVDASGKVAYQLLRADGPQLTDAATAVDARALTGGPGQARIVVPDAASTQVSHLVARMGVAAGGNVGAELSDLAVADVLVPPAADPTDAPARSLLVGRLDATAGLERITENTAGVVWRVVSPLGAEAAWARAVTPAAAGGRPSAVALPARAGGLDTRVKTGSANRVVVLAERADPGWRAWLDGRPLRSVTADWRQTFDLGKDGGRLVVGYAPADRTPWLVVQGVVGLLTMLLALPIRRRRGGTR